MKSDAIFVICITVYLIVQLLAKHADSWMGSYAKVEVAKQQTEQLRLTYDNTKH